MKRLGLALACAVALVAAGLSVHVGPEPARAVLPVLMTSGDSALAAAGSFKIYPLFTPGGAHMHAPQWVTEENGYVGASGGYIFSSASNVRVNVYGPVGVDTSGFTVPAGGTNTRLPACDSVFVINTGGAATTVSWGLYR